MRTFPINTAVSQLTVDISFSDFTCYQFIMKIKQRKSEVKESRTEGNRTREWDVV